MSPAEKDAFKKMLDAKFPPNAAIVAKAEEQTAEIAGRMTAKANFQA